MVSDVVIGKIVRVLDGVSADRFGGGRHRAVGDHKRPQLRQPV